MEREVMKIKKILLSVFFIAFAFGVIVYLLIPITETKLDDNKVVLAVSDNLSGARIETKISPEIFVELKNWKNEDESNFKVKLLEIGEFHGGDLKEKSSKNWIGLFKEKGDFILRATEVKVRHIPDILDNEDLKLTGRQVSVKNDQTPIFLLKNADFLKEGKVKTLFHSVNGISLENGLTAEYQLNDRKYTLSVIGEENSSTLILESEGERQIVYSVDKMGDGGWNLYWIGDLDGDGKLDLYANLTDHYNFVEPRLFLSSQAKNGKLIQQVAMFHISGC